MCKSFDFFHANFSLEKSRFVQKKSLVEIRLEGGLGLEKDRSLKEWQSLVFLVYFSPVFSQFAEGPFMH